MIKLEHFYDTATTPIDVLKFVPSTLEESFFSFELMMMLVVGVERCCIQWCLWGQLVGDR